MEKEPYIAPTISVDDFGSSDVITASVAEDPATQYLTNENGYIGFYSLFDL
ncbi:MAG: hypothetical protein PUE67_08990 [Oscillospiraceae bacterium]|nr:hypothetical protein [Oscillospiraceae bacterium]